MRRITQRNMFAEMIERHEQALNHNSSQALRPPVSDHSLLVGHLNHPELCLACMQCHCSGYRQEGQAADMSSNRFQEWWDLGTPETIGGQDGNRGTTAMEVAIEANERDRSLHRQRTSQAATGRIIPDRVMDTETANLLNYIAERVDAPGTIYFHPSQTQELQGLRGSIGDNVS